MVACTLVSVTSQTSDHFHSGATRSTFRHEIGWGPSGVSPRLLRTVSVASCLKTFLDELARRLELPEPEAGDVPAEAAQANP